MALSTLNQIVAGMQAPRYFCKVSGTMEAAGVMHSLLYAAGLPGAGVAPSPGLSGAALTSYAGQLPFQNPVSGNTNLARLEANSPVAGTLFLCDRLWHNSGIGITTTTAQTVNSVAFPARDALGLVNGHGVMIGLEASSAIGGGAVANTTISYTNNVGAGTSGKTGTMASWPATAAAGTFVPFQLAAGDGGVRSVESITLGTTYTSGTVHLVAYRVLAALGMQANVSNQLDAIQCGFPQMHDGAVPFLIWLPSATTSATIQGSATWSQG
jgi:hypothetical protein